VQVNGKVRDSFEVSKSIDPAELESLARGSANVQRYIGDREIVKVIVRAPKLVNIAIKG
jgi:leucyl-tRNA synthetase